MPGNDDNGVKSMIDQLRSGPLRAAGAQEGRVCALISRIRHLPPAELEAVMTVMGDHDVKNRDMLVFINARTEDTGVSVTIHQLRFHRAVRGCIRCVLGG
jgi:hypothetical protein